MERFRRIVEASVFFTCLAAVIVGGLLTLILFLEVICRYVFNNSLVIVEELARVLLIWLGFLGASIAYHDKAHVGIDFLRNRVSNNGQRILDILVPVFMILFCTVVLYQSCKVLPNQLSQKLPTMQIPIFWAYLSIPVSMVLLLVQLGYSLISAILGVQIPLRTIPEMFGKKQ